MKKIATVFLVLALLFAVLILPSCSENSSPSPAAGEDQAPGTSEPDASGTSDPGTVTPEMLEASKPNEYVPEKVAAGMEVLIGFSFNSTEGVAKVVETRLLEEFPAMGLTLTSACDNFDTAAQITNIENFITMGCAAILIHTTDSSLLESVVGEAEDAGTSCILYGEIPKYDMSYTCIDLQALGYSVGLLAREWINQTLPDAGEGSVKVAVHGSYANTPGITMSDSIVQSIQDDPRCVIVYSDMNIVGLDSGFTFAQQALTTDQDIRLFAGFSLQAAFGCSNYVMSLPDVVPEEYCSVGATYDVSAQDFLEAAKQGQGIFRGCTAGNSDPAWGHLECIQAILFEHEEWPVVRMQEITAFSNGLEVTDLMNEFYYGVYTA